MMRAVISTLRPMQSTLGLADVMLARARPSPIWQLPLRPFAGHAFLLKTTPCVRTYSRTGPASWQHQSMHRQAAQAQAGSAPVTEVDIGILIEGEPLDGNQAEAHAILESLEQDAAQAVREALLLQGTAMEGAAELSVVLASDAHMAQLNTTWRGKEGPTDVLSFPMDEGGTPGLPVRILGDLVISLDTAQRQAQERGYGLQDECRVLLVHGLLHLLGFDHEAGAAEAAAMAAAEQRLLRTLGWQGEGLIGAAEAASEEGSAPPEATSGQESRLGALEAHVAALEGRVASLEGSVEASQLLGSSGQASTSAVGSQADDVAQHAERARRLRRRGRDIKLVCIDMDGTLLDSKSKVLPSSVEALRAALAAGVRVCLATGKARPAAMAALTPVGLAGDGLVVSPHGPGIFLQGLAVHGQDGSLLPGKDLEDRVVQRAFEYAMSEEVPLCAFLGDTCATLRMTDELEELHSVYYEPLARVVPSLSDILEGPPVKKLLFMTDAARIDATLRPHWKSSLGSMGASAEVMQAVPTMLELVPSGVNKWVALQQALLPSLGLSPEQVMGIGDGGNDLAMVANVGLGVAMANAVPEVLEAAVVSVASNDEGGVAEAIERFILSRE